MISTMFTLMLMYIFSACLVVLGLIWFVKETIKLFKNQTNSLNLCCSILITLIGLVGMLVVGF